MSDDAGETPDNLVALVAYLKEHPRVFTECDREGVPSGERRFVRVANGGLWFRDNRGKESYLPVDCGLTAAETGVAFHPGGFDVTKFGVTIRYRYLP